MIIFPLPQRKTKLIIAVSRCYHVVLRLSVNLKLIKDTQLLSLLTCLLFLLLFFQPLHLAICSQCFLSLRISADGKRACCLMPGGRAREGRRDWWREGGRERGEAKVYSCGQGTAVQSALTCDRTAVTLPWATLENDVDFSRSLTLLAVDGWEITWCFPTLVFYTLTFYSFLILKSWTKGKLSHSACSNDPRVTFTTLSLVSSNKAMACAMMNKTWEGCHC